MCDPLSIGIGMAVVGTGLQYKAQQDRNKDMRRLNRRETERQDSYYNASKKYLDENQATYERGKVDADMEAAAANRQSQYAAADRNAPRANEAPPGSKNGGNAVVMDSFRRALEGAQQKAAAQGAARAELASFGDFMGDAAIDNNRRTGYIGMNGSFSQGSANVLPLELNYAATRPRGAATIGNLLTALGGAAAGSGAGSFGELFGRAPPVTKVGPQTIGMSAPATKKAIDLFSAFG